MHGGIDEGRLRKLLVESDDLQSDAIKGADAGLADCVERHRKPRLIGSGRTRARLPGWPPSRRRRP
jgi:hypothetical protein